VFSSPDYSIHIRIDGGWWVIDTVDNRGEQNLDVEKYLVWIWSSAARSAVGAKRLGPQLYSLGFA
jgi:hypothetical protein